MNYELHMVFHVCHSISRCPFYLPVSAPHLPLARWLRWTVHCTQTHCKRNYASTQNIYILEYFIINANGNENKHHEQMLISLHFCIYRRTSHTLFGCGSISSRSRSFVRARNQRIAATSTFNQASTNWNQWRCFNGTVYMQLKRCHLTDDEAS